MRVAAAADFALKLACYEGQSRVRAQILCLYVFLAMNEFPDARDDGLISDTDQRVEQGQPVPQRAAEGQLDDAEYRVDDFLEPEAPTPFWTRRRIFLTVIAVIIVITLMAYMFSGLFVPPRPPATPIPGQLI